MKIWILDDNHLQAEQLKKIILDNQEYSKDSVFCLNSEKEFIDRLKSEKPDVLIADIELGEENNGITLVKNFLKDNKRTQVIYLTGYSEYCCEVYETKHIWFLLKPLDTKMFFKALNIAKNNILNYDKNKIIIKKSGEILSIYQKDIIYVESEKRKMKFYTINGSFETYMTNDELIKYLNNNFIQCHRSYFVNMDHIKTLIYPEFIMSNGVNIPISQLKRKSSKQAYLKHISSNGNE